MCFCIPTAVEVDTIDRTPYGRKVVRKTTTYGLHTTSDSSFDSSEKSHRHRHRHRSRRRFGAKTDYYDDAYRSGSFTNVQRTITYDMPIAAAAPAMHQPLLLEQAPPMPVLHQPQSYVNVVDAHPSPQLVYNADTHVYNTDPVIYDAVPTNPRAGLPRGVSMRRPPSGVRYGHGNPHDSDSSSEFSYRRSVRFG